MKRCYIVLLLALIAFNYSDAQVKILFDATKAETAGNADWVIDADVYNIYWNNSGSYSLTGSEANGQQIPTPAQSGITSSTAQTYWVGGISAWGVDMVKKGYTVETLPVGTAITYGNSGNAQDLSKYKVFVICEPNIRFTTAEKTAMMSFVQNGGGLFMVGDHNDSDRNNDGMDSPHIWNDFMDTSTTHPFGIHFDYADFSQTTTNVASLPGDPLLHGIMGNVTKVMWSGGNTMTLSTANNPTVKGVIFKTGASTTGSTNCMVAYATYGTGRVVAIGDSSPCDDGSGDPGDVLYDGWIADASGNHEILIVNATIWLAGGAATLADDMSAANILVNKLTYSDKTEFVVSSSENIKNSTFCVYDMLGHLVYKVDDPFTNKVIVNNNELGKGIFIYKLLINGKQQKTEKFAVL